LGETVNCKATETSEPQVARREGNQSRASGRGGAASEANKWQMKSNRPRTSRRRLASARKNKMRDKIR
jgi:hypothetical protein